MEDDGVVKKKNSTVYMGTAATKHEKKMQDI